MLRFAYTTSIAKMAIAMQRLIDLSKKDNNDYKTTISNKLRIEIQQEEKLFFAGCQRTNEFEYAHIVNSVLIPLNQFRKDWVN